MIGIYKITSPTEKVYVGQSINIERRWKSYKKLQCKQQTIIYRSLVKHGWINHRFEVIEECSIEQLNEREAYWIKNNNCVLNGMNCIGAGNHTPYEYPEEAKLIKSEKMKKLWKENKLNNRKFGKRIKNLKTGEVYNSCREAAQQLGINPNTVTELCNKKQKLERLDMWRIRPSTKIKPST